MSNLRTSTIVSSIVVTIRFALLGLMSCSSEIILAKSVLKILSGVVEKKRHLDTAALRETQRTFEANIASVYRYCILTRSAQLIWVRLDSLGETVVTLEERAWEYFVNLITAPLNHERPGCIFYKTVKLVVRIIDVGL